MGHVTCRHLCGTGPGSVQAELRVVGGVGTESRSGIMGLGGVGHSPGRPRVVARAPGHWKDQCGSQSTEAHPRRAGLGGFENLHVLGGLSTGPAPLWDLGRATYMEQRAGLAFTSLKGRLPQVPHLRPLQLPPL